MARSKKGHIEKYGLLWPETVPELFIEMDMVRNGGFYVRKDGTRVGHGLFYHMKRFESLLWPEKIWHKWSDLQLQCYLEYRTIGIMGPASSGKTLCAATDVLADYLCWPECTTVLCCSSTKERLEERVWAEIKKFHRLARERYPMLPGNIIEGRQRIVTDPRTDCSEGRDFRNGMVGVPCKRGGDYVGLGDFCGIKNKRVRVIADELHLLPRMFIDAISNLDKNPDLKVLGLGNPNDTTNALGVFCEPAPELGGWDGGIDQAPGTKTWKTRRPNGICIQFWGPESPNLDGKLGIPLITQEQIDRDIAFYGKESLQYSMMDEGRMPRGLGSRRVLTRQLCEQFHAREEPYWQGPDRIRVAGLDAAYRGVGGDRCVLVFLEFGPESITSPVAMAEAALLNQSSLSFRNRQIIALTDLLIVPIQMQPGGSLPEDQIVYFVRQQCERRNVPPENVFFDSGMRTSLVMAFARLWSNDVNSVDCGGAPSDDLVSAEIQKKCSEYYSKFITELWYSVRLVVEAGQFRGLTDEVILEFCSREWRMTSGNKIEVEPKDKMKEKTGRSPDLADAVAVALYGARQRGFRISKPRPSRPADRSRIAWKEEIRRAAREFWKTGELDFAV